MSTLYTLPNSTSGLDTIIVDTITATDSHPFLGMTTLILGFVFFTVFLGGMYRQKARYGTLDAPMWATVASLMMFMTALVMSMTTGIINLGQLSVVIVITVFCGVWLFLSHKSSEL